MNTVPDGYRREGEHGLVLIDPEWCPHGHPVLALQRKSGTLCDTHDRHLTWICDQEHWIYRANGAFVDELDCC